MGASDPKPAGALVLVKPTQVALAAAHQTRSRRSVGKCARSAPWILASVAARFRKRPVLSHGALAGAVASFCAACQENKKSRRRSCLSLMGLSIILVASKDTVPSERMVTCPNMTYKLHKSALGCIGDSESPWTSHEESDVEKTLAVYGVKSHHVRTVRKAAKDPWITNTAAHIGCAQFERSWPVDRAPPPWSAAFSRARKPKPRYRMTDVPARASGPFFCCSKYFGMFFCELYYESSTFAFCDQFVACNCGFHK